MTALQQVRRTQRLLGAGAVTQALGWGVAITMLMLALISFAALAVPTLSRDAGWHLGVALTIGMIVVVLVLVRSRYVVSPGRVALWIEERIPDLHYTLITAIEHDRTEFSEGIEATVSRQDIGGVTLAALRNRVLPAVGAAIVAALLLYVSPSSAFGGGAVFPRLGSGNTDAAIPAGSRLEKLRVRVTPPGYTGEQTQTLDDPSTVTALAGSRIVLLGDGQSSGITASANGSVLGVASNSSTWSVSMVMPVKPAALTLRDRNYDRIVVLDPRADAPPKVILTSPTRDSTLRVAQLVVQLDASASDDIGLGAGYFEYLITTGSGEIFSARTVNTPAIHFGGAKRGTLSARLDLASLKLSQGDVISIRAIVQDGNSLTGPGLATSDTRTFRIARADEYDSVAIEAAAPQPIDSSAMSQRMLIMMTEKLVREQPRLTRKELVRRSGEIGDLEDRIRKRVHEILFEIEGGGAEEEEAGATPDPTATLEGEESDQTRSVQNPDLFEAFNALWAAVRALQIAEPAPALPPMRVALKALDRVRLANRLYLRGTPPKVIVDIARVRMTGKEKGSASVRTPRSASDTARAQLERRFSDAIEMIPNQPANAIRAFTMLQVEALSTSTAFASALGEAIDAFRKGKDATPALIRARRAIAGDPTGSPGLPAWSGDW